MKKNLFTRFFSWIWGNRKVTEIVTEQAEAVPESAESVPEPETAIAPATEPQKKQGTPAKPVICYNATPFPLVFDSIGEAARKLDVDRASISRCLNGKQKHAGGFIFGYAEGYGTEGGRGSKSLKGK